MSLKFFTAAAAIAAGQAAAQTVAWISPEYTHFFEFELPQPPVKQPLTSVTNSSSGRTTDFFEIDIRDFEQQMYPELPATPMTGYDGMSPGPTFRMERGREAVVRFVNNYDRESSIHLHGSFSRAPWDGWAEDLIQPGQFKDYYYPNAQPERTLWYHDHAVGITAENANTGQAGFYILDDPQIDFGLPTGPYDIPLSLSSRSFNADGTLMYPGNAPANEFLLDGDVITVNGQPWPYFEVEPRKYRFRLLDSSMARSFLLSLTADENNSTNVPFTVVASDSGYTSRSVSTETLAISQGERWEVVVDFAQFAGQNMTLANQGNFNGHRNFPGVNRVLRFVVGDTVTDNTNNGAVPETLSDIPAPETPTVDRTFVFAFTNGVATINGTGFRDVEGRILARPERGNVERWILVNNSPAVHPIHVHLVDFQIVSRTGGRGVTPYEQVALKDIAYLDPNEQVEITANFAPWPGVYMFHCHNLVHEDNDMMAAFNVTITPEQLEELGYGPSSLLDPTSFPAQQFTTTDIEEVRNEVIPSFTELNAYPEIARISRAEWVPADSPEAEAAPEGFAPPEKRALPFNA